MFYVYVKIYSRNQLNTVNPGFLDRIDSALRTLHGNKGGTAHEDKEGLFRYAAFYEESLLQVIEAAMKSRDFLENHLDDLDGYNIIITDSPDKDYEMSSRIEHLTHQILEEGGIWIDPGCYEPLLPFLVMEKEYSLIKMTGIKAIKPQLDEQQAIIMRDRIRQGEIDAWLTHATDDILVLKGEKGSGRLMNLKEILKEKYGHEGNLLILRSPDGKGMLYDPYIDLLSQEDLSRFNLEQKDFLIELTHGHMMQRCSDFFSKDFESAFIEYLDEKARQCASQKIPLVVFFEHPHTILQRSASLIKKIFDRSGEGNYRIAYLHDNDNLEDITDGHSLREIRFYPETGEQVKERLSQVNPDIYWTSDQLNDLEECTSFIPAKIFHGYFVMSRGEKLKPKVICIQSVIDLLSAAEKRLLAYIHIGRGIMRRDELFLIFREKNDDESIMLEQLNRFKALGLIQFSYKGLIEPLFDDLDVAPDKEIMMVKEFIALHKHNKSLNIFRYLAFLEKYGMIDESLDYLSEVMNWLINNGLKERARGIIENPPFSGASIAPVSKESLTNLLYSNKLRLALLEGDREELDDLIGSGILSMISERGRYSEDFYVQFARYYYIRGNMEQTVNYAKDALYSFQKQGNHLGESLANIELAFAYLGQRKVQMAMDYFEIARRISYQIEDNYSLITAHTFGALAAFLFGNISKAETMIEQVLHMAVKNGSRNRIFFLTFLSGRIRFEYGHYKEGAELFEKCVHMGEKFGMARGRDTARRWTGRCLLYLEKRREAFKWLDAEDESREGLFFLAESDFMVSLYESALSRLEKARNCVPDRDNSYSERDFWCDGFRPVEGRFSSLEQDEDVLSYQIEGLNSHILALTGRQEEAMQFFTRQSNHGDFPFKPYSYKYSYIHFTVLNVGDVPLSGDDHRLASLSRAIERLQSRAGRFDNQRRKLDFLNKNWWNKRIMVEAHRKKFL